MIARVSWVPLWAEVTRSSQGTPNFLQWSRIFSQCGASDGDPINTATWNQRTSYILIIPKISPYIYVFIYHDMQNFFNLNSLLLPPHSSASHSYKILSQFFSFTFGTVSELHNNISCNNTSFPGLPSQPASNPMRERFWSQLNNFLFQFLYQFLYGMGEI